MIGLGAMASEVNSSYLKSANTIWYHTIEIHDVHCPYIVIEGIWIISLILKVNYEFSKAQNGPNQKVSLYKNG